MKSYSLFNSNKAGKLGQDGELLTELNDVGL